MQTPSVLATRATRKTTRFGQRDAKCNAAGAMHRASMGATDGQRNFAEMRKTWEKQGLPAERTGTVLFGVFPMFLDSSNGSSREIADRNADRLPRRWRMTKDP
jgi:hypothetical protein